MEAEIDGLKKQQLKSSPLSTKVEVGVIEALLVEESTLTSPLFPLLPLLRSFLRSSYLERSLHSVPIKFRNH